VRLTQLAALTAQAQREMEDTNGNARR